MTSATRRASSKVGRSENPENDCSRGMRRNRKYDCALRPMLMSLLSTALGLEPAHRPFGEPQHVGVVGTAQTAIGDDRQDQDVLG